MAVWQFKFSLMPRRARDEIYGASADTAPEYSANFDPGYIEEANGQRNPWDIEPVREAVHQELSLLLPERKSWSSEASMFGSEEATDLQLWPDEVQIRLDMREFDQTFSRI